VSEARHPIVVDFAPHAVHYAGTTGDTWHVALVQYPSLLTFDRDGAVVARLRCANVLAVSGPYVIASTAPRVLPVNVQREPPPGPGDVVVHDLATGRELWRREKASYVASAGSRAILRTDRVELVDLETGAVLPEDSLRTPRTSASVRAIPGGFEWTASGDDTPRAFAWIEHPDGGLWDWEDVRLEDDDVVVVADTRILRVPLATPRTDRIVARVVPVDVGELPLEPAAVFFVSESRVLVDHRTRGRFWFELAGTGLARGDAVEIGGFLFNNGTTIATTLVRNGKVLASVPARLVPDEGDVVVASARFGIADELDLS
jgi:hypothetical protein